MWTCLKSAESEALLIFPSDRVLSPSGLISTGPSPLDSMETDLRRVAFELEAGDLAWKGMTLGFQMNLALQE